MKCSYATIQNYKANVVLDGDAASHMTTTPSKSINFNDVAIHKIYNEVIIKIIRSIENSITDESSTLIGMHKNKTRNNYNELL